MAAQVKGTRCLSKSKRCQNEYCGKLVPKKRALTLCYEDGTLRLCAVCGYDLMKAAELGHKAIIKFKGKDLELEKSDNLAPAGLGVYLFETMPEVKGQLRQLQANGQLRKQPSG